MLPAIKVAKILIIVIKKYPESSVLCAPKWSQNICANEIRTEAWNTTSMAFFLFKEFDPVEIFYTFFLTRIYVSWMSLDSKSIENDEKRVFSAQNHWFNGGFSTDFFLMQICMRKMYLNSKSPKKIGVYRPRLRNTGTNIRIGSKFSTVLVLCFEIRILNEQWGMFECLCVSVSQRGVRVKQIMRRSM